MMARAVAAGHNVQQVQHFRRLDQPPDKPGVADHAVQIPAETPPPPPLARGDSSRGEIASCCPAIATDQLHPHRAAENV